MKNKLLGLLIVVTLMIVPRVNAGICAWACVGQGAYAGAACGAVVIAGGTACGYIVANVAESGLEHQAMELAGACIDLGAEAMSSCADLSAAVAGDCLDDNCE